MTRTVFPTVPPRVQYELTRLGRSLLEPVSELGLWARRNRAAIAGRAGALRCGRAGAARERVAEQLRSGRAGRRRLAEDPVIVGAGRRTDFLLGPAAVHI